MLLFKRTVILLLDFYIVNIFQVRVESCVATLVQMVV